MHPKLKWKTFLCLVGVAGLVGLALSMPVTADQPVPLAGDSETAHFDRVDAQQFRAKQPAGRYTEADFADRPRGDSGLRFPPPILEPVGPEVIFDQSDQDCGGVFYVDTYASLLGFLVNYCNYCYSDGTPPTPEFVATGQAHLYWLDQISANGDVCNGIDLKYFTDTLGPAVRSTPASPTRTPITSSA